ncbi:MAG: DUF2236 domain-containing protein [Rhizobiales bacterium]|nr:DUF2236 domain-containing protein [Hyphomicrobiales bacterium]
MPYQTPGATNHDSSETRQAPRKIGGVDFLHPKGDPGLSGPGSVAWRVRANNIASGVGGVAAVILELAEPAIRAGVWDHSTFKVDPIRRMVNTGNAAMALTYGPRKAAETTFARVTRMHERVSGLTHEGKAYQAMDPALLTWVHVTAAWGFLNAFIRYVDPSLSRADQDRYYAEGEIIGKGFGAQWVPTSVDAVEAYMAEMTPKLYANDTILEFLELVRNATPLGAKGKPIQRLIVQAAIDLLPPPLQKQLGLKSMTPLLIRPSVAALARLARFSQRFADGPPQQACRRMGVSTDYIR